MFLIVGLGNPGAEYAGTRHNAGFQAADYLYEKFGFSPFKAKFDGLIAEGKIAGEKVFLLKPQTYMNLSGDCIRDFASFYKIQPENIIIINKSYEINNSYSYLQKSNEIDLNNEKLVEKFYNLGKPITMFPNPKIKRTIPSENS